MPRFTGLGSGNRLSLGLGRLKGPPPPAQKARIQATGGTLSVVGSYNVHTFTTTGTFTVDFTGSTDKLVEVLVVGGGGGGGIDQGGGGGGSEITTSSWQVTSPSASYLATVGGGGATGAYGANSSITVISGTANPTNFGSPNALISRYGSRGGNRNTTPPNLGACGGGAAGRDPTVTNASVGWYLSRTGGGSAFQSAGGGAGLGGNGSNGTTSIPGDGAAGATNSIRTGAAQVYGAGGGGGGHRPAPLTVQYSNGGSSNTGGRGARGQWTLGCSGQTAGVAGSGSGGGGGLGDARAANCGAGTQGGSGIVVFRYIRNT
jgi:hypothetical protein